MTQKAISERPTVSAILFDKDGTLLDLHGTWTDWALAELRALLKGTSASFFDIAALIGLDPEHGTLTPGGLVASGTSLQIATVLAQAVPELNRDALVHRLDQGAAQVAPKPMAGVAEVLAYFAAEGVGASGRASLAVVTNDSERAARAHIDALGLNPYFGAIIGADSGGGGKPDAGPLLLAAQRLAVPEGALCAMVGDSTVDLMAARAAGMVAIAVPTGVESAEDLAPFADIMLTVLTDLPDAVKMRVA